jgi:RHS repeat-associated protein
VKLLAFGSRRFVNSKRDCYIQTLISFKRLVYCITILFFWGGFFSPVNAEWIAPAGSARLNNTSQLNWPESGWQQTRTDAKATSCEASTVTGSSAYCYTRSPYLNGWGCYVYNSCVYRSYLIVIPAYEGTPPPPDCPEGEEYNPETQQCEPIPSTPMLSGKNFGFCPGPNLAAKATVGNPIHAGTGNKFQREVDLSANTPNGIRLIRYYNSHDERAGALGSNWRHNYDRRVDIATDGSTATVIRGDAKTYIYTPSDTAWQSDPDVTETLTETATGWTYTMSSGTVEQYDINGRLVALTDLQGRTQSLSYDAAGKLTTVIDAFGHTLTFTYDAQNRINQVNSASGNIQFSYDANNNLQQVTYPDATTRQYLYENTAFVHALTGIIDENNNRYATWSYDAEGRSTSSEHANGVDKVSLTYNADGTTTVTNSRNISSTYSFVDQHDVSLVTAISGPGCSSCGTGESSYQYDPANNNLLSKTIHGLTTEYGNYDNQGNPDFKIVAKGTTEERRIDYTYDPRFASKVKTFTESSVYATGNKVTTYDYDDFGNTTRIRIDGFTPDGTAVARETTLQYLGPLNQLSQIDGPRTDISDITTLDYYPNDPAEGNNRARLKRVTTAGTVVRDNLQYSATGKVASETRPNGITINYSYYPGNDRLQTVTESDGINSRTTRWTYLATGEVETITRGHGTPDATTLTFGYDDARRLTSITDGLGNKIQYTLDTEGNKEKEDILDDQSVLHKSLTQTFDDYNRLNLFTQANENSDSNFAADGTLDKMTDGNGTVTDYGYDDLKRLVTVTQDMGGTDTSTQDALTQYGYDIHGNLTAVTDPNNGNTTYVYDDLGNLLSQTSPDTGTTTFMHDAAGNVTTRTDAKGQSFAYSYDALNRLATLNAPGTADDITYTYDTCNNGVGRLCTVIIGDGAGDKTITYTYDAFGNVISQQGINYSYDSVGRIKTLTYPSGNVVTYMYDTAGQVNQVNLQQGEQTTTLASGISYAPFGPVTSMTYGNGHTLSQGVDSAYRFTDHTVTGALQLVNSLYDANGNLNQVDNSLTTVSNVYNYDALNRLDTANGTFGSQDFGYDKNGNRLQLLQDGATLSYTYEANSNRLDVAANDDVVTDANGNITTQGLWTYTHTAHNRLANVSNDSVQIGTYAYNGLGQRISKTVDSVTQNYLYSLNGELLQETDGTASVEYVYLNGQPLAVIQQGTVYYLHNDHLGTPRVVTDASKTVVWRWDSDPFGSTAANDDPDNDGTAFTLNLRFPGQYYDSETGLHYNYFRYYDPSTGRYITSDPIGLAGGLNTYGYVEGNPVNLTDPLGLAPPKPLSPERQRRRECNSAEYAICQQTCGSRGVQSCKVNQTFSIQGIKKGLPYYGWNDGPMSCSCNDPEGFCSRNPKTCAAGVSAVVCILLITPIPDDVLIPGVIAAGAASQ